MSTGYTAGIKNGISFEEYVLRCARNFGACITMRDEPFDKPIPEKFEESDYYKKKVENIKEKLQELKSLSDAELQIIIDKEYENKIKDNQERILECKALKEKYDEMLYQVNEWNPPSKEHIGLKNFMIDQINISYSDCDYSYYENKKIIKLQIEQYKYEKEKELLKDLDYHMKRWKEEAERTAERNLWIKQLRESLK